jgi:hypothetical protein
LAWLLPIATTLAATAVRLPPVARRAAGTVSGIAIRYPRPPGGHELAGQRAADLALAGGGRLYETLRDGRFVLISAEGHDDTDHLRAVQPAQPNNLTMLVRPDGYVAWAAETTPTTTHAHQTQMRQALAHWCL